MYSFGAFGECLIKAFMDFIGEEVGFAYRQSKD